MLRIMYTAPLMRILVIEDEHRLARNIQSYLQMEEHYTVDAAFTGEEGVQKALHSTYDCIILDITLHIIDGYEVCKSLRGHGISTPILMLTSLTDRKSIVRGLNSGADDYLKKPFEFEELCARIRALLRRTPTEYDTVLTTKNIVLDPNTQEVTKNEEVVNLAPKEYALLEYLLRNKGKVQDRQAIIEHVWGELEESLFSQTVDVHVAYLRKKLGHDLVTTVPGTGYLVSDD